AAPATQARPAQPVDLTYLKLFALYPLLDLPVRLLPSVLIAEQRAQSAALMSVFRALGMGIGIVVPAALDWGVSGIVSGLLVFGALHFVMYLWVVRQVYPNARDRQTALTSVRMIRFAFPLAMTDIVGRLNSSLDQFLVLILLSAIQLAEYRVGAWQIPLITTVAYSTGA